MNHSPEAVAVAMSAKAGIRCLYRKYFALKQKLIRP
jgi:hypothetical protein